MQSSCTGLRLESVIEAFVRPALAEIQGRDGRNHFSRLRAMLAAEDAPLSPSSWPRTSTAPAYLYWFQWQTPILDGRPRAFHCAELPFVFYNTDRCATMTGGGPEARELAGRIADAWVASARTGNPNHKGLPKWPALTAAQCPTMVFDNTCAVANAPDSDLRRLLTL